MQPNALELAVEQHRAGNLMVAEALYREVLEQDAANSDVFHLLGLIAHQRGEHALAIRFIQQALGLDPHQAVHHFNLGCVFKASGKLDEAASSFREALLIQPNYPEACRNLVHTLRDQGGIEEAARVYRPDLAQGNFNFAYALEQLGRLADAAIFYLQTLRLDPTCAEACCNLGRLQQLTGRLDEAISWYEQALRLRPDARAATNLGTVYWQKGQPAEALYYCNEALHLEPQNPEAHFLRANLMLLSGNYEAGWPEYEWRLQRAEMPTRFANHPRWDGSPLDGRTILLHTEQGLGDTLQFVRYAPLVKRLGGNVLLECPTELQRLLKNCAGVAEILEAGASMPHFDVQASLLSLPAILKTTLASVPATIPYLYADAALVESWRTELRQYSGFRIGIIWQGNPKFGLPEYRAVDKSRSFALSNFEPLARLQGAQLFSLQKGYGREQLPACQSRFGIVDLSDRLGDFMDTAAAMMNLDLIISLESAPAHLAGALGRSVWTVLPYAGCWRWLQNRDDSPWYPTMRLFRQSTPGNWGEVFDASPRKPANGC